MNTTPMSRGNTLLIALLLLAIFASRITLINVVEFDPDEIWTIWQTFGTPQQIIQWTPSDWPPGSYLLVAGWKALVGYHPVALRMLPLLAFMLGCAFTYRVVQALTGSRNSSILSMLAYAAPAYMIYHSLQLRGYILILTLVPAALWVTMVYLKTLRWWHGILLGILMAAMFYSTLPAVFAFMIFGLYSILARPRQLWRWWLPGATALLLAFPLVVARWQKASSTVSAGLSQTNPTLPDPISGFLEIRRIYGGSVAPLWGAMLIAAVLLVLWHERPLQRHSWFVWLWFIGGSVIMFILNPLLNYFVPRHAIWLMVGMALMVGIGFGRLPRLGKWAAMVLLCGLSFVPMDASAYESSSQQVGVSFAWLADHVQSGDTLLVDPILRADETRPEISMLLDYYEQVYLPAGIQHIQEPADHRRIWFVTIDGWGAPDLLNQVSTGRIAREFVGPWNFLVRLYEAPPDPNGITFGNGMRLHGVEIIDAEGRAITGDAVFREQENVRVRLWWSVAASLDADYSYNTLLLTPGGESAAELNGPPQLIQLDPTAPYTQPAETSQWVPGQYYIEERLLTAPTQAGTLHLGLVMYQWWDGALIDAPGTEDNGILPLRTISVMAW